jgi:hypothetical protein
MGGGAFDDFAYDLVARDEARPERGQIALDDVKIRAADAAGEDAEEDMAGLKLRQGNVFNLQEGGRGGAG